MGDPLNWWPRPQRRSSPVQLTRSFGAYGGWIPLAAGLVVLLPGIALVDALEELASGQLTAGASRMANVGVVFLSLTLGAVTGYQLAALWPKIHDVEPAHLPEWFILPALLVVAIGSALRFRARASDYWLMLAASTTALVGSRLGKAYVGELAGPFWPPPRWESPATRTHELAAAPPN